jgi:hypothetical protein
LLSSTFEPLKHAEVMEMAFFPETRMTPNAPTPGGVAMAAMVSSYDKKSFTFQK